MIGFVENKLYKEQALSHKMPLKHQVFVLISVLGLGTLVIITIGLLFFAGMRRENDEGRLQVLLIVLEFVAAAGIVFAFFNPLARSLSGLAGRVQSIGSGRAQVDRSVRLEPGALLCRELADIAQAINGMMDEIERLNRDIKENHRRMRALEAANRQTEIAFLRSQINPHFLSNTLTLICGMAAEGKAEEIIGVADALSGIYRYSIKGGDTVRLRDEVAVTEAYVMIQSTRFVGRFTVEYDIEPRALDAALPGMLLQPLVENAVEHGLEGCLAGGRLTVGARLDGRAENLLLWVWDTGLGMDAEQLAALREQLHQAAAGRGTDDLAPLDPGGGRGVGLRNVNSRLYLQYGSAYRLEIDSAVGGGTRVNIRIPCEGRDGA